MRESCLNMSINDYIHDVDLAEGLQEIGVVRVHQLLSCPFIKFMRNKNVMRNWDSLVSTILCLRWIAIGEKQ